MKTRLDSRGFPRSPTPVHRLLPALLASGTLLAAGPTPAQSPDVRARIVAPAGLAAGTTGTVAVELTLGPGWHANSHTPSEKFLIPTVVTLGSPGGTFSPVRYPKDVERKFSFADSPLRVYEGTVRFEADLTIPKEASGPVPLSGSVSYQACNDRQCFAPAAIPLQASVAVLPAGRSK